MDGVVLDSALPNVFRLEPGDAWKRWRDRKLAARPASAAALVVEVRDPRALTRPERAAIAGWCRRANMAIYASALAPDDPSIPSRLAGQLGLAMPQPGPPAERDGIARMPWHTEGFRNASAFPVRATVVHCRCAAQGGELALMDPELAWLLLREAGAEFARALSAPDAFSVPGGQERHAVFATDGATGDLRMRFTERRGAVEWKCDATVSEAAARLRRLLDRDASCVLRTRLEGGMGIVGNNVLLARSMAADAPRAPLLRERFRERVAGTEGAWRALA